MADTIHLAVLGGTTREKRESIKAAHWVADFAATKEAIEVKFVDPKDFNFPGDGNDPEGKDPRYSEIVDWADAFFIVTPEYNHSFPGSLKRMLDSELALYNHKPVAFAGASNGNWGGVRAVESLLTAIRETGLVAMSWDIYFPRVQDMFDESGAMKDEFRARYEPSTTKLLDELFWFARMFKANNKEG